MDKRKILPAIGVLIIMGAIIIKPSVYILSAQNGIILFAMTVLPALFPFFFFSRLLCVFQADIALGNLMSKPLRKLYNVPSCGGYILAMSLMCGYPIGAKLISEYYSDGIMNKQEAGSMAALASTAGPLFILGTIGAIILKNREAGYIILISHYIAALINGLIYRNRAKNTSTIPAKVLKTDLRDSIYSSVISILMVGGYIVVFNIVCDVLLNLGVIDFLTTVIPGKITEGAILSLIEVTRGAVIIGSSEANIITKTAALSAAVTFGGMSIIIQTKTFLERTGIKLSRLMLYKFTQCAIAYVIALLLALIIFKGSSS